MPVIPKSTTRWSALTLATALLWASGCGGGSAQAPPVDPPVVSEDFPWRINSLAIPEWYTTLTTQPIVEIDGEIASWSWEFGTGALPATSTEQTPTISLQAPGDYGGTLTITNGVGRTGRIPFTYRVLPPTLPTIEQITPEGLVGEQFTPVTLGATLSGGPVDAWHWDFPAGALPANSDAVAPQIELQTAGQYTGTLKVCGPFGCSEVREFTYESREPRFVWHPIAAPSLSSPHASDIAIVRVTSDGRVALVYGEKAPGEPQQMLQLALTDSESALAAAPAWTIRTLAHFDRKMGTLNVALAENNLWVLAGLGTYYEADQPSILLRTTLDGTETVPIELPDREALWRSTGTTRDGHPMFAIGDRLYFAAVSRSIVGSFMISTTDLFTLTSQDQLLPPPVLQLSTRNDTNDLDMIVQDGQLHFAVGRSGSGVGPDSFLEVGRLSGDPQEAAGDWSVVVVDDARVDVGSVTIIPTDSGMHLWYGAYHIWERSNPGWSGTSVPSDYAMRQAWTDDRHFTSASTWETARFDELPDSLTLKAFTVRGRPLVMAGPSRDGWDGFHTARALNGEGGHMDWLQSFEDLNTSWLTLFSCAADSDGAWIGFVQYESAYMSCGGEVCSMVLYDPRLIIGKIALE